MTQAWHGGEFGERGRCLLAPNPGLMTLDGTNSWILTEPGGTRSVVVDPGPIEDGHVAELDEATGEVELVLLTHHHFDHSEAARDFARLKGCPVRAFDPAFCLDGDPLADGEAIEVDGLRIEVLTTADSVSLLLPAEGALLSGDMVLGRGTTVVAYPDGQLGPYLDSIERMRELAASGAVRTIWPAHGPVLPDALGTLEYYLVHRRERLAKV